MKLNKSKLSALLCLLLVAMFATSQPVEAQFLKKLSKGLEKVNKKLEEANEFLNDPTQKNKKKQSKEQSEEQMQLVEQSEGSPQEVAVEIDDSDWEEAESNQFQRPYITKNTLFMEIPRSYRISPVNDGVFAIDQGSKYSFWKITGEKLLDAEWEYCNESDVLGQKYPLFNSGVASARRTVANAQGHKVICLLYTDGSIKEMDPSWKEVTTFKDGLAIVTQSSYGKTQYFYINVRGEKVYPNLKVYGDNKQVMRPLCDGLRAYSSSYNSWGFIDANGKEVIPADGRFVVVGDFSEGYAWAVIKDSGKIVASDGELCLIDMTGKIVFHSGVTGSAWSIFEKTSPVRDGVFYIVKDEKYHYYDTNFNLLASYDYASPFYGGYAYISDNDDEVSMINRRFEKLRTYSYRSFDGVHSLKYQPRFDPIGLGIIEHVESTEWVMTYDGHGILGCYEYGDVDIRHYQPFTNDGIAIWNLTAYGITGDYCGYIRPDGEILWVFCTKPVNEARNEPWPVEPVDPVDPPVDPPADPPVDPPTLDDPALGPTTVVPKQYRITVTQEGEGKAFVSPPGPFIYGENSTLTAKPAEDWAIAYVDVDAANLFSVTPGKYFPVTSDISIHVKFVKKEEVVPPVASDSYQGNKTIDFGDGVSKDIAFYAQISSDCADANPYGDNTYGFIAPMFDPTQRIKTPDFSTYIFAAPLLISGYQHDEESSSDWLVLEGGSMTLGGLKIGGDDPLASLYFALIMAFNGESSPSIVPRHYRLEMLDMDKETGEFTCGTLQVYSAEYGWVEAGSEKVKKEKKGFMMTRSDSGLPADYFQGIRLKTAPKRDDVHWYPPIEWYDGNQEVHLRIIEEMGNAYRNFQSDYDKLFDIRR